MESIDAYLAALASEWPTPGGGSAAILVAASGASLVSMVARICSANPKYEEQHDLARSLISAGDALRADLLARRVRDEEAFDRVVAATAMPRGTPDEKASRARAVERALHGAAAEPLGAAKQALAVLRLAEESLAIRNANLVSDVGCAAEFGYAGLASCAYNVRINHRFMKDAALIALQAETIARYEREGRALLASVRSSVNALLAPRA
ncbi:MAG TPA: cyclodeaminase/cyclohydrolase family protein [Candidatus Baltobacteraceae bacterium]